MTTYHFPFFLIAVLIVIILTGCGSPPLITRAAPPASVIEPCPVTPKALDGKKSTLLKITVERQKLYDQCASKVEAMREIESKR
jgi:hypothetical protein